MAKAFCSGCGWRVRISGLFACALALLACADTASASWSSPVTVTAAGAQYSFGQDVGADGRGAVVWSGPAEGGSGYSIFERGVSKAGSLGTKQEISQAPTEAFYTTAYHPTIRYAADNTATVVWLQSSYSSESCFAESEGGEECEVDEYVEARQIEPGGTLASQTHELFHRHAVYPAGGPFGASSPAYVAYGQPAIAAGPGETLTVAWPQSAFGEGCQGYAYSYSYADGGCEAEETIQWVRLSSSGEAEGPPQTAFSSETNGYSSGQPLVRMRIGAASDGTATVLFSARIKTEESECWGGQSAVEVLQIGTGGVASAAQELDSGCGSVDPRLVVQSDGSAVAAWSWEGTYSTDEALYARIASDGTPGEPEALLGEYKETRVSGLDLARGLAGSTVAVWAEDGTINSREIPSSGSPGSVRTVATPAEGGYLSNPRIALAPVEGSGAVVWEAQVSEGGYATGLQGTELAADGTPGNVRTLLSANRWDHGARVSAGGDGSLMASWRVSVPHENKIQAVRLSTEATTSNDNFAEAQVLDPELPSFAAGSNEGATTETGEPNHAGDAGGASVWYAWTAEESGPVAISTCASGSLDTLLGVYTGTAVNELTTVASADSGAATPCSSGDSEVRFEATSGTTYLIAVDGKGGTEGSFGLKINARNHVPANDDLENAKTVPSLPWSRTERNVDASKEPGEPEHAGNAGGASVWYSWTAAHTREVLIAACGYELRHPLLGVYTGTEVGSLTEVGSADGTGDHGCGEEGSGVRVNAVAGTTYKIAVDGRNGREGRFNLRLYERPANDDFAGAQTLSGIPTGVSSNNYAATRQSGEPEIEGNPGGASVWYSWTPSASGTAYVSACMYGNTALLGVYTGSGIGELTAVGTDAGSGTKNGCYYHFSEVGIEYTAGTKYYIVLDGKDGAESSFALNIEKPPANDDFAGAQALSSSPPQYIYSSNRHATRQSEEPEIEGNPGGASLWYSWTPTSNGTAFMSACMSGTKNTLLGVYTGSGIGELTAVGTDAGTGTGGCYGHKDSEVQFEFASGTTYHIAVDGEDGEEGPFTLRLEALPANDDFENAQTLGSSLPQHVYSSNRRATRQSEEPEIEGNAGGASVWYSWTPASSGIAVASACLHTSKHTLLGVYTGSSLAALSQVGADAGTGATGCWSHKNSEVQFEFASGTTYYIAVDGEDGAEAPFELAVETQTTGWISGTVTSAATHEALSGASVCAYSSDGGGHTKCTSTGSTGEYKIARLPVGEYKVEFYPGYECSKSGCTPRNYITQYYDGKESWEEADPVTVNLGETTSEIDAELVVGGQISGTVTDAETATAIKGVEACAYEFSAGEYMRCASTDEAGHYTINGLQAGEYRVQFNPPYESNYVRQYYNGKEAFGEADPVTATLGETTSEIDAELVVGGQISGTVTGAVSHEAIKGVEACAYEFSSGEYMRCASTDEAGHYTINGLQAGEYRVEFWISSGGYNYVTQYYDGKESWGEADPVTVNLGETTPEIDAALQPNAGRIAGTVTDASSHAAINGASACAYDFSSSEYHGCASTDSEGRYAIGGLPAGEYRVQFNPPYGSNYVRQYYNGKESQGEADPASVSVGETTSGIDAELVAGGHISGTVTDAGSHAGIKSASVCAYDFSSGEYDGCASTDEEGHYTINGLAAGEYRIQFTPPYESFYLTQYYDGKEAWGEAEPVAVSLGETTSEIDAELVLRGHIAGTVTDALSHEPVQGVEVCTYVEHTSSYGYCSYTDEEGNYTITGLPADEYEVRFHPPFGEYGYLTQYYNAKESLGEADAVPVSVGETASGIDAVLQPSEGHISGTVTDAAAETPVEGVEACAYVEHTSYYGHCTHTDGAGHYTITGLPAGEYEVQFEPPSESGYLTQYFHDREGLGEADAVAVSLGETTTEIDAELVAGGTIAGTVTDASSHEALEGVEACAYDFSSGEYGGCASTGEAGHYTITGLPAGEYRVEFNPPFESGYLAQYYSGKETWEEAEPVTATLGATTPSIDAELVVGGTIAGTVTDGLSHEAIAEAYVCAYQLTAEGFAGCAYTGEEGHYAITGLPAGEYEVEFTAYLSEYGYFTQYYNGKESSEEADPVPVSLGETTSGIDAALGVTSGQISGTVTGAETEAAVEGVYVCAFKEGASYGCAYTDEEGIYTITGVPAGEYAVGFLPPYETPYAAQLYSGKESFEEADPVTVNLGETTPEIDAELLVGGTIAGTVTDAGTEAPVEGAEACTYIDAYPVHIPYCAYTDEEGKYAIGGLPTGTYHVSFSGGGEYGYFTQYYNGRESSEEADPVSVIVGETTPEIDAALQPSSGHISGTVTDAGTEAPVEGVEVCTYTEHASYDGHCASTDEEGNYTITGLPAGEYEVQFEPPNESGYLMQYFNDREGLEEADAVSVSLGETASSIDAALHTGGTIAGTVTDAATEAPVEEVSVCAYEFTSAEYGGCVSTDEEGNYTIVGLAAGEYRVEFWAVSGEYEYLTQYYNGRENWGEADPVTVSLDETTPEIDAALEQLPPAPTEVSPPTISGEAQQGETLTEHHGSWANEPTGYEYQWLRCDAAGANCTPILGATEQTYELTAEDAGHKIRVEETASNAGGSGEATSAATGEVLPLAPSNTAIPTISGEARQGQTLSESHGSWEPTPESYEYQWLRCDKEGNECQPISGETGDEYLLVEGDVHHTLRVRETASNSGGAGEPATSAPTAVVVPPAPVNTSPPTISGTAEQGQTLLVTHGTWTNSPSGYEDQWLRCDPAGENCTPISGATASSYVVTGADVGHTLRVRETASNGGGPGAATDSAQTGTVAGLLLHADAGEDLSAIVGESLTFDGSASTPAGEIDSYEWSFGDGESASGETVVHTYAEAGTYEATLTVKHGSEEDTSSANVQVLASPAHQVQIEVTDEAEAPISGAQVLYIGPDGARTEAATDGTGKATLTGLPDGTVTVYAHKGGYRPAAGQVEVSEGEGEATIQLAEGDVVTTTLEAHEMNLEEIEAAGINPDDPANNMVFEFEVGLAFASIEFHGYVNGAGNFVGTSGFGGGGGSWTCTSDSCSNGEGVTVTATTVEGHPVLEWLILRGKVSILKQFFDVSMVIQNLAEEPFELAAGTATLNLPSGLSLAPTAEPQSLAQSVGAIAGQSSATVHWIVRGDKPGEYNLSARYDSTLEPFEAPVSVQAATAEPLKIWGADALALKVQTESGELTPGRPYHVRIGVMNKADIPLYNVAISVESEIEHFIFQPDQQFTDTIAELGPGETHFAPEYILVPDPSSSGTFESSLSYARFVGEEVKPGEGVTEVSGPPLFDIEAPGDAPGLVHLHWESVPGAEGYEVFPTADLTTPFGSEAAQMLEDPEASEPKQLLPASATDAYLETAETRYYAVSTLIGGRLVLDKQVIEATPGEEPPSATSPPTITGTTQQGETLTEHHGSWEPTPESYEYQWLRCDSAGENCTPISGATNQEYELTEEDVGHKIKVEETASNEGGSGEPATSAATGEVLPLAPSNTSIPTITGEAREGQTLTEHQGSWEPTPESYEYQWLRCDSAGENCTPISGATTQEYELTSEDVGHKIKTKETASNTGGSGEASSAATGEVLPLPPSNTAVPTISGTAQQGETLTENHGSWTHSPTGYEYQWLRCDSAGENCTPISGATEQTYELTEADVGHKIKVEETAENAGGQGGPATSGATGEVLPMAPSNTSLPTISGTPEPGHRLTCSPGSWANNPSFAYAWLRDASQISGATAAEYEVQAADQGHTLSCEVTAENAGGSATATSAAVSVPAPPPTPPPASPAASTPPPSTPPASPAAPVLAKTANIEPASGKALVRLPGTKSFVPLGELSQIPYGATVDATHGTVVVTTAGPHGGTQTAKYSGGMFVLSQAHNGTVVAKLSGGKFSACSSKSSTASVSRARRKRRHGHRKHVVRKLWTDAHGKFSTKGHYAVGAVQGTKWLTADLCGATLIKVKRDRVRVTDLVRHRHVVVKAGHSYLAKARRRRFR